MKTLTSLVSPSIVVALGIILTSPAIAETGNTSTANRAETERYFGDSTTIISSPGVEVIGSKPGTRERIPGSATVLEARELQMAAPLSGMEVLRRIPGVHAVEQDGAGMRTSIGVRGLDPNMSRTLLVLEDGIPVALLPYGEPEMYYTPAIERMVGVELLKGHGSIVYGPRTIGGVLNYLTAEPPPEEQIRFSLRGGPNGFAIGNASYGNTFENVGVFVNYLHKRADRLGITSFNINDVTAKVNFKLSDRSTISLKTGFYDEQSNSTYVGLTQTMFDAGNLDFTHPAPDDFLAVRRYSASVAHRYEINPAVSLTTTLFGYSISRNWSRQDFDNSPVAGRTYARTFGDTSTPFGALYFRDSFGNRNRSFDVGGVESRLNAFFSGLGMDHEFTAGVRFIAERASEQRINGKVINPLSGALVNDERRGTDALSAFVQNKIYLSDAFTVTPGLRTEVVGMHREIYRQNSRDTLIENTSSLVAIIPGIGVNYQAAANTFFFAGVHRGFAPPRITNAITVDGLDQELDGEFSWNSEIGVRTELTKGLAVEATGFYMDFSNQIIPVAESAGGAGNLDVTEINGGATRHLGIEASIVYETSLGGGNSLRVSGVGTYLQAEFSSDRFLNIQGERKNISGNVLPYAPRFTAVADVDFLFNFGLELRFSANYTAEQLTDPANTIEGSNDGRVGVMPEFWVADIVAEYPLEIFANTRLSFAVKNVFNERYIASRRPQGIRVGLPRMVTGGIAIGL